LSKRHSDGTSVADTVGIYLEEVSSHTLLTADDEVALARAMESGRKAQRRLETGDTLTPEQRATLYRLIHEGEEAKMEFIRANLRLVISIAKRYAGRGLDLLDLIQEGNLGLIRAVEKFDWRKGFKFSTYATWWIRQAITRGLGNQARTIRLPVHMVDVVRSVQEARQNLTDELRRAPTLEEIAAVTSPWIARSAMTATQNFRTSSKMSACRIRSAMRPLCCANATYRRHWKSSMPRSSG
jgi:RNA polymerase sigma factor (sigma-70 family)